MLMYVYVRMYGVIHVLCLHRFSQTDPKNTDYVAEHGAVRTFQAHRVLEKQEEERKREKEEQEANDPMLVRWERGLFCVAV